MQFYRKLNIDQTTSGIARIALALALSLCATTLVGCSSQPVTDASATGITPSSTSAKPQESSTRAPLTVSEILGAVGSSVSVGPKTTPCNPPEITNAGQPAPYGVEVGPGKTTVYFTAGGRSAGFPVTVSLCPVTSGSDLLAQGYTVKPQYNTATGDSSAESVQFGRYTYSKQVDKFGGFTYQGFANGQFVTAGAGGAAPTSEAESIISTVLTRIP